MGRAPRRLATRCARGACSSTARRTPAGPPVAYARVRPLARPRRAARTAGVRWPARPHLRRRYARPRGSCAGAGAGSPSVARGGLARIAFRPCALRRPHLPRGARRWPPQVRTAARRPAAAACRRARAAAAAAAGAGGRVAAQRARDSGRAPEGRSGCCRDEARALHPRAAPPPRRSVWHSSALAWAGAQSAALSAIFPGRPLPAPSHPQRAPPGRRANSYMRSCVCGGRLGATVHVKLRGGRLGACWVRLLLRRR